MVRYAPLSNPAVNPDEEMDAAFENSDDEDEELSSENAHKPLLRRAQDHPLSPDHRSAPPSPGVTDNAEAGPSYNFEYDYDFPPPGSPPRPSALALPNEFGNTNGQLPQNSSIPRSTQPAIFRRMLDAVRPSHRTAGVVGGGMSNDGVFGNVMAKPGGTGPRVGEEESDGPFWAPELVQKEAPPVRLKPLPFTIQHILTFHLPSQSYAAAQLDAVPGYWENTILAPSDPNFGDLMIEGLPTGSIFAFLWNALFSMSFQFVGFLLTHLLAGSHASK